MNIFEQRDFGNKINATFQYVGENIRSYGLAVLYIVGPVALVSGIATGILQSNLLRVIDVDADDPDPVATLRMLSQFTSPSFWLSSVLGVLATVFAGLVTYAHMKLYAEPKTPPTPENRYPAISVADVWSEVQPMIGRGIVITLLSYIIMVVGFLFLLVPGIYVAVVLSLALAVTTFEGTDFGATWNRCFQLIRDKWWSTFGLIMIMAIIVWLISLVFGIPAAVVSFMIGPSKLAADGGIWLIIANVIAAVGQTLLSGLLYVAIGFQYTNLVERQEGRGLISAVDSIGTSPTQPRRQDEGEY